MDAKRPRGRFAQSCMLEVCQSFHDMYYYVLHSLHNGYHYSYCLGLVRFVGTYPLIIVNKYVILSMLSIGVVCIFESPSRGPEAVSTLSELLHSLSKSCLAQVLTAVCWRVPAWTAFMTGNGTQTQKCVP